MLLYPTASASHTTKCRIAHYEEFTQNSQTKSVRLAGKASTRVGKDTIKIAQYLLIKKLGDLASIQEPNAEADLDSFVQHLDQPLTRTTMEALKTLAEESSIMKKKTPAGKKVKAVAGVRAA